MKANAWMCFFLVAAVGCDRVDSGKQLPKPMATATQTTAGNAPADPLKKPLRPIIEPKANNAPAAKLGDGQNWAVSYVGDLEGTVGGDSLVVISSAIISNVRGGVAEGDAKQRFVLKIPGNKGEATFDLNLADGTRCFDVTKQAPARSQARVADPSADKFEAEVQGELWCGDQKDKNIQFKAKFKK